MDSWDKVQVRRQIHKAVLKGELIRPTTCSECLRSIKTEGHHPDYTKPLDVVWLCRKCHMLLHRKFTDGAQPIQVMLTPQEHAALKIKAIHENTNISQIVRKLIKAYIK